MPSLRREIMLANMILQFPNPLFPPQAGAAALITTASIILDQDGQAQGHPQQHPQAAIPTDITDTVLDAINLQMARLGLTVTRLPDEDPTEPLKISDAEVK